MARSRAVAGAVTAAVVLAIAFVAWLAARDAGNGASSVERRTSHPTGGVVKAAVGTPPEMVDKGTGGDALRALVLPRLFVTQPDGSWHASAAQPGSDHTARDARSASFRLRPDLQWTDGTPLTVDDLRRTMDKRFVERVDGPDKNGAITAHFTMKLPGWRRLWSGAAAISQPKPDVYGGPFVLTGLTSGLETVVRRNPTWKGPAAYLDEVRLVLTADPTTAEKLLAKAQVDVVAPAADTVRTDKLRRIQGVEVSVSKNTGRWAGLRLSPAVSSLEQRQRIVSEIPRKTFVNALLHDEADLSNGIAPEDNTWSGDLSTTDATLGGRSLRMASPAEQPLAGLLGKTVEQAVTRAGGNLTTTVIGAESVQDAINGRDYDLVLDVEADGAWPCFTCAWQSVDASLAAKADGHDEGAVGDLSKKLRDEALFLPLWRDYAVTGWRSDAVRGLEANGYEPAAVWNAENWWKP